MIRDQIVLRPLEAHDEEAAIAAHEALAREDFTFLLDHSHGEPWATYLQRLRDQSRGLHLAPDRVPSTFLKASVDGVLVGRISIRHELNDHLAVEGGHIGYGVVPRHRRRGHATAILGQGIIIARSLGVDLVLVTCDDDNVGSQRAIEHNGGVIDTVVQLSGSAIRLRRYWIR